MATKELAGHKEIATTLRYMHLSPSAKNSAISLLNAGAPGNSGAMSEA